MAEDRSYTDHLQDKLQAMQLTGDALATALAGFLGPEHQLIRMWDEAKRHGEVPAASRENQQEDQ